MKPTTQQTARNPADVSEQLAADDDWLVRQLVARNRNTPPAVLERLAADPEQRIRHTAGRMLAQRNT